MDWKKIILGFVLSFIGISLLIMDTTSRRPCYTFGCDYYIRSFGTIGNIGIFLTCIGSICFSALLSKKKMLLLRILYLILAILVVIFCVAIYSPSHVYF